MRLLLCHAESARFETGRGVDTACLVCFCTLEQGERPAAVRTPACEAITDVATHLGVETVLVASTSHLSHRRATDAAGAAAAEGIADRLDESLDAEVRFVPVDEHTGMELDLKGHPHARQSVRVRGRVASLEGGAGGEWRLSTTEGASAAPRAAALLERLRDATDPFAGDSVAASAAGVPWWDEGSVTPREQFIADSIEAHVREQTSELGAAAVETGSAPRQVDGVTVQAESGLPLDCTPAVAGALRAGDDHGEPGRWYRLVAGERHGSDTARRRTTPQLWARTTGVSATREECERQIALVAAVGKRLGFEPLSVVLADEPAHERHGEWLDELSTDRGAETVVGVSAEPRPWDVTVAVVGQVGERVVRLGSTGLSADGVGGQAETGPLVCSAVVASVGRAAAASVARGRVRSPARLPAWLSPAQLRLVPTVPDEYTEACGRLADEIETHGVRVTIDSRPRSVGDRLADAAAALVPYVAVVGREEADGDPLRVTDRSTRTQFEATPAALGERLGGAEPTRRRPFPRAVGD